MRRGVKGAITAERLSSQYSLDKEKTLRHGLEFFEGGWGRGDGGGGAVKLPGQQREMEVLVVQSLCQVRTVIVKHSAL